MDRHQTKFSKPRGGHSHNFVREDEFVLKWQPQGGRVTQDEMTINTQMIQEEEKHSLNNRHFVVQDMFSESVQDYNQSQIGGQNRRGGYQSMRGRGRYRGQNPRSDNQLDPEGLAQIAHFAERGRGRGRGFNHHQTRDRYFDNSKSLGQPGDFQESKPRSRGRGQKFYPRNSDNHWAHNDSIKEQQDSDDEKEDLSTNGGMGQPFIQRNLITQDKEDNVHCEEKMIQDKRSMQTIYEYQDFCKPEFFQGPQFLIKRQGASKQWERRKRSHQSKDIQQEPRERHDEQRSFNRKPQNNNDFQSKEFQNKEVQQQGFDYLQQKRVENKFWNEGRNRIMKDPKQRYQKKNLHQNIQKPYFKTALHKYGSSKAPIKMHDKMQQNWKMGNYRDQQRREKSKRQFKEYLNEEIIQKGLENGTLFEGLFKVNANNRQRAFVSVNGFNADVMIENFFDQNRALDGDTVVIELLPPAKWLGYTSTNVIIGKDSLGKGVQISHIQTKGFTNETAIETRIVDLQVLGEGGRVGDSIEELKEEMENIENESKQNQNFDKNSETSSDEENEEDSINEQEIEKVIEEEEKAMESSEETGHGLMGEDKVSSEDEVEGSKEIVKMNPQEGKVKDKQVINPEKDHGTKRMKYINGTTKTEILAEINKIAKDLRPLGRIMGIIKSPNKDKEHLVTLISNNSKFTDEENLITLEKIYNQNKDAYYCGIAAIPVNQKLPYMGIQRIPQELIEDLKSKKKSNHRYYIVKLKSWSVTSMRPQCNIISSIGEAGNLDAESLRILKSLDICSDEYETQGQKINENVDESLRVFTKDNDPETGEWKIHPDELKRRVDLRGKRIFTIDPITAKDLDDALSIDKISNFIYEIGVHIADVSYFVQQGTELDKEAQLRCTSVYFVHKVYPMLPRLLCERLCSLNPNVDRLAYSIFFRMDIRNGEIDSSFKPKICRTVIRSCAKWNYQLVQEILDNNLSNESQLQPQYQPINGVKFSDMRNDCFLMNEIAQKRRNKRLENGSILLQNREFTFVLDQETKMPITFQESYRIESKFLVEEYMLLANILIAEHLHQYCKDKTLLRAHPDLNEEKKDKLKQFYDKVGLGEEIDLTDSKSLSTTLENLREKGDSSRFNVAMRKFLTCLQCAKYVCINQSEPAEYQHFGLNFPLYTHFTSPIRRYADLLVHRLVTVTLQHKEASREMIELMDYTSYAELCSEKSYNAKKASQQCTRLFHCLLLKSHGVKVFETLLFDMDSSSISIYIDEVNMHHKLRLRDDARIDSIIFFEDHMTIVAHMKKYKGREDKQRKLDLFKKAKSVSEIEEHFSSEEFLVMRIFDKVKVKVETTTEFPLDIKCTLMFTNDDGEEFQKLLIEQEEKAIQASNSKHVIEVELLEMEQHNDVD